MKVFHRFLIVLTASVVFGCDHAELAGPPNLRLGRDECAACGMLVDDAKSSSALLVERGGRREHLIFDDIGCMIDYQRERADVRVVSEFVHDYASVQWSNGASSSFVIADPEKLRTPMASGIVACVDQHAAQRIATESGGRTLKRGDLGAARIEAKKVRRQFPIATQPG